MKLKTIAIIQARRGSSRLPDKILKKVNSHTLLDYHISRVKHASLIDEVILATTTNKEDQILAESAKKHDIHITFGSESDVLDRYYQAAKPHFPCNIVRLTADCPLIDASIIDEVVNKFNALNGFDYVSNNMDPTYPDGMDVEVFSHMALEKAFNLANLKSEREHVTPFIWKNSSFFKPKQFQFRSFNYENKNNLSHIRLTVDELEDCMLIEAIISHLGKGEFPFKSSLKEIIAFLNQNPRLIQNTQYARNEGYAKSLNNEGAID